MCCQYHLLWRHEALPRVGANTVFRKFGWACKKSLLLRRLSGLSVATGLAQGIQMVSLLALAKLYPLPEVGEYVVLFALVGTLAPITLLCFESLIPTVKEDDLVVYLQAVFLISIPSILLVYACSHISSYAHATSLTVWVAGVVLHRFAEMQSIRSNRYLLISAFRIFSAAGIGGIILTLHMTGTSKIELLIRLQAWAVLTVSVGYIVAATPPYVFRISCDWRRFWNALKLSANAPKFLVLANLLNLAAFNLPVLVLQGWFGAVVAAQYGYVLRFGFGPVALLGGVLYQIYYGHLSEVIRADPQAVRSQLVDLGLRLRILACGVTCTIAVLYPWGFYCLLGEAWQDAGWMAVIFAPFFGVMLYMAPWTAVLNVFSKQLIELRSQAIYLYISIMSFSLAILSDNVWVGVTLFSSLGIFRYLLLLRDINSILGKKHEKMRR